MTEKEQLIERYSKYSTEELFDLYNKQEDYTEVAREALKVVIDENGGLEGLLEKKKTQNNKEEEKRSIEQAIAIGVNSNQSYDEILSQIQSQNIAKEELEDFVNQGYVKHKKKKDDKKITTKSVIGGIIGSMLGVLIGSALIYVSLEITGKFANIVGFVSFFIAYGFIRLFTKQSLKNAFVLIMCIVSTIITLFLGVFVYQHYILF